MCADGLLVGPDDADTCGSIAPALEGVDGNDALPRGGGHQAFAKDSFRRNACAGPIAPCGGFSGIEARKILQAIHEQMSRNGLG